MCISIRLSRLVFNDVVRKTNLGKLYIISKILNKIWNNRWTDERPMLETLDYTIHIGSTPTFLYFDLYPHSAYAAHYVYFKRE